MTSRNPGSLLVEKNMYNLSTRYCMPMPPFVNSNGIWQYIEKEKHNPLEASLPRLELQIIAAFSVTQAIHYVLKRLGISLIVSQIVVCSLLYALPLLFVFVSVIYGQYTYIHTYIQNYKF